MKAKEFDKKFDDNEDISAYLDISRAHRPDQEQKREKSVTLPEFFNDSKEPAP